MDFNNSLQCDDYRHFMERKRSLNFAIKTFFVAVIVFGVWMIVIIMKLAYEYQDILLELKSPLHLTNTIAFKGSILGFGMGIFTFIIIFILWGNLSKYIKETGG